MSNRLSFVLIALLLSISTDRASSQSKWFTVYYPVWSMVPLGVTADALPPWEMDWRGITHVIHFFNKNNVDTTTSPYFSPVTIANDSIDYEFYGIGNPGSGPSSWKKWQDSLITIAHRNNAKVFVNVQSVDAKFLNWVVADSIRTEAFVNGVVGYCERKKYDGVEINWEGWITPIAPKAQSSRLFRRFRSRLDQSSTVKVLSLAPVQGDWNVFDPTAANLIDQINIQLYAYAYAWYSPVSDNASWYVSPLFRGTVPTGFDGLSWDTQGPIQWVNVGYNPAKLGLGGPTFGWILKGMDTLYQATKGGCNYGYAKYWDCLALLTNGGVEGWDDQRKVPYIKGTATLTIGPQFCASSGVVAGQKFWATYDNPRSIQEKVTWLKTKGYGGVMLFDMTMDLKSSLPINQRNPLKNAWADALMTTGIVERQETEIPHEYYLDQNYPNPFNPSTIISYSLPRRTHVSLTVFNSLGQAVTVLVSSEQDAGKYKVTFDTASISNGKSTISTGIYFYRLETSEFSETKKLLFIK